MSWRSRGRGCSSPAVRRCCTSRGGYRELTGADAGRANRFDLSEQLIELLTEREWLLVVDEAQ